MGEFLFIQGNEAVGWGAVMADCEAFFGYPITPQNEVTEWFAREFPKRGKVFLQSQCETASINMLYGAAATGVRAMTSTSSPGWGLMLETMSHLSNAELPCVVVLVMRGGPGAGTTRHSQMDYTSATRSGGPGGYHNIVLAPASVQELHDHVQLAFCLADKYRNPVVVLSDAILGQMAESMEVKRLAFPALPPKDFAVRGTAHQSDGRKRIICSGQGFMPTQQYPTYLSFLETLDKKWKQMKQEELRYEVQGVEDAKIVLVAFGSLARVAQEAMEMAREEGLPVGLFRPISLWPFPYQALKGLAHDGQRFMVVEDNLGQMVEDVETAVGDNKEVHFLGSLARHEAREMGMIFPDRVLEELKKVYER